jgi:superfamily II DNA or RNA helicase
MVVKTRLLADQQTKRLKEYIPGARVECSRGNNCEEDSQQSVQLPSVSDALCRSDIIVCTAGKLVDGLKKGNLGIGDISLLVLDECHNTDKGSNYAQVMHAFLEQKVDQKMQGNQLPQIVGLTATPGVGKNPGLNPLKEVDKAVEKMGGHANLVEKLRTLGDQELNDASQISEQGIYQLPFILQLQ